ncbi:MAG: methyltransferase family protein [Solirubrobacterales bacterium]
MDIKDLIVKTAVGFAGLFITLGVVLFLTAWSIYYIKAWIYLFAFAVPVLLITIYLFKNDKHLLQSRVKAGPGAENEKSQKSIQSIAQLAFISIYIISGLDYRFHWSNIQLYISYAGDIFVVLGLYIVFLVFKENTYTSAIIEVDENQKVISTGPYGYVRHPMYSGALLMMLFTPIALGSYFALIGAVILIYVIVLRLFDEEKFLSENLKGYKEYCSKVVFHLIPHVW